jgi:GNAT superfamily N-acetyltransferase
VEIQKATINNTEVICTIGQKSFLSSHGKSASKKDIDTFILEHYNPGAISKELSNSINNYFLFFLNSTPLGFSNLQLNNPPSNLPFKNVAKLDRIYFLEETYGKGFGSELLQYNIEFSIKNKQQGIWLFTWVENDRAVNFYRRFGFKTIGKYDYKISETHANPNHVMYLEH